MTSPDIDRLSVSELRALVAELFGRVSDLNRRVIEQREEIARLKGLKGRPDIKPSMKPGGLEKANRSKPWTPPRRGGGPETAKRVIDEERIVQAWRRACRTPAHAVAAPGGRRPGIARRASPAAHRKSPA
jgi:hypothetical protein